MIGYLSGMLQISERTLEEAASTTLDRLQKNIDRIVQYSEQVTAASTEWKNKASTSEKRSAFNAVRQTLAKMSVGAVRCAYCEDSAADEIEHIYPKSLFPDRTFVWGNYLYSCGPCNGPKGNKYGIIVNGEIREFVRRRADAVVPPPEGLSALINPRVEDPMRYLEIDLGGRTPDGEHIEGTFEFLPIEGIDQTARIRAIYSIDVLNLNREVLCAARGNAYSGFSARLHVYVERKEDGATRGELDRIREELLSSPHISVFAEMVRQRALLPDVGGLLGRAPEVAEWRLTMQDEA